MRFLLLRFLVYSSLILTSAEAAQTCGNPPPQRLFRDEISSTTVCGTECGRMCFQKADVAANLYLSGDFAVRIGTSAKPTFLEECTAAFVQQGHNVACREVHEDQSSIRVVVGGPEDELLDSRTSVKDTGMDLASFPPKLFLEPFDSMFCTRFIGHEGTCWADTAWGECGPGGGGGGQDAYDKIMQETDVRKQYMLREGCGNLVPQQCLQGDQASSSSLFKGNTCATIQAHALCVDTADAVALALATVRFQTCAGQRQCGCPSKGESWGLSNNCALELTYNWGAVSSCKAGCTTNDISFQGGALTAQQLSDLKTSATDGELALTNAINALDKHVRGSQTLSASDLATQSSKIDEFAKLIKRTPALIQSMFDLVDTYESSDKGPLFVGGTRGPFARTSPSAIDGHELERAMLQVQQSIMDEVYNAGVLRACSRTIFANRGWKTASYYPGAAPMESKDDDDDAVVHSVVIKAHFPKTWGRALGFDGDHAQKPTGFYLSPGALATVTVPDALVGKGYKIMVGVHESDNKWKSEVRRMDRVTTQFDIDASTTYIANPLGGGVYVLVPPLADAGLVEIQISGGVIASPLFRRTSFDQMTNTQWRQSRMAPAPWADFETDAFMLSVPRSWIYNYDDAEALMERYAKSMDGAAEWLGYPPAYRNRKVLFVGVDLHIRASAYGVGYPQVNTNYNQKRDYG